MDGTDYPSAPPPGERPAEPDLEAPQDPGDEEPRSEPEPAPATRRTSVVVITAIGVVVLLSILVVVVWLLTGRDDTDSGAADEPTTTEPTPSEDPSSEVPATGCSNDLCLQAEALVSEVHTGADDVAWTLEAPWADAEAPADATGSGTAGYTSDAGEVTLTVVGFDSGDEAADYAESLMEDLGEPETTRPVWDDPQEDRGEGELNIFTTDDQRTLIWYDDAGVVSVLEGGAGTDPSTVSQFYYTLPAI